MKCRTPEQWDLFSMGLVDEAASAEMREHAEHCGECRAIYGQARRDHTLLLRAYETLDRDHESQREKLLAALPAGASPSSTTVGHDQSRRGMGGLTMLLRHRRARAALLMLPAAACIAFIVTITTFTGGHNAFAAAIERFQKARTIVCRVSSPTPITVGPMSFQQSGTLYVSSEFGSRFEMLANGSVMMTQYMPPRGPITTVSSLARSYMVIDARAAGKGSQASATPDEFIRALASLKVQASRELGWMAIDGVETIGYEITGQALGLGSGEDVRSELWIEPKDSLPVRYLTEMPGPTGDKYQLVFDRFEWDRPVDPAAFTPDIPEGYTRVDATMPVPDENTLIKALGNYAELTGKYPPTLDSSVVVSDLASAIASRAVSRAIRGQGAPDQKVVLQKSVEIGSGIGFYQKLVKDGCSPEYHGKTVTPSEADGLLLRWKLEDGRWRVVYGDLRVETVDREAP